MIISASRRTDIPAFYSEWFINRVRAGYCEVPNPYNPKQISTISLDPADVEVMVFWTRDAAPLIPRLQELDNRGYRYYFLYTLLDYPALLDPGMPPVQARIDTFRELAQCIGKERVIWRYDPIVFSNITPPRFHLEKYGTLAAQLRGSTQRCIVSTLDVYDKLTRRLRQAENAGCTISRATRQELADTIPGISAIANDVGITVQTCAEDPDLSSFGIHPGKCIDDQLISSTFNIRTTSRTDSSQRDACLCVESRDIGCYDTCIARCTYCYATSGPERAAHRHKAHDVDAPSIA